MQFHPTTLAPTGVLITEGCRGEGAYLLNKDGERFLKRYAPNTMELASRDVISRAEQMEIDAGRGVDGNVLLDLRHLGAETHHRAAAGVARALDDLPRRRSDLRPDPGAARSPLPHGRCRHRRLGADRAHGPLRSRRVRVRLRPRRQPARGQRAHGDDHLRKALGKARGGVGALAHDRRGAGLASSATPSGSWRSCSTATTASARGRSATSWPRRCTRTSASSGASSRWSEQGRIVAGLRDRYGRALVEDKGEVFNSDLTRDDRARLPARPRRVHGRRRDRAQGEPWCACAPGRLSGARRRELHAAHDGAAGRRRRPS